ncbi:MAG TPA: hypothetical protein VK003_08960 [Oceanobacillus sp.]|nr:hypothetical protein [Oceanobacillus sp.]
MSDIRSLALSRAYELVEAGKPEEARTVLEPILINDRDNADAWWIYAHAVTDPAEARHALGNVLRINPNYPGATELMQTLEQQFPPETAEPEPAAPPPPPEFPDEEPDFVGGESFWEDEAPTGEVKTEKRQRSLLPVAIVAGIIVLLVIILALILPSLTGSTTPTPTPAQIAGGVTPSAAILIPPTEEVTPFLPEETEATLSLLATIGGEVPTSEVVIPTVEVTPEATELLAVPSATEPSAVATDEPVEVTLAAQSATEEATEAASTPIALAASPAVTSEVVEETEEAATQTPIPTEAIEETETVELPTKPVETLAPTEEIDLTPDVSSTEVAVTDEAVPSDDYVERIAEELQAFSVAEQATEEVETSLGTALLARVCTLEGPELRSTLREVMGVLVDEVDLLPTTLNAIGVRLINCDGNRTLRIIIVDRESATGYAAGVLTQTEFEAQWRAE